MKLLFGNKYKKIHFTGINGIGMSGVAELLAFEGIQITGSDRTITSNLDRLKKLGAAIWEGHDSANITDQDLLVYTPAVSNENPELIRARELGIKTVKRSEVLSEFTRCAFSVCVSGTHGKTSTSSMITKILIDCGLDPTALIGGNIPFLQGSNARKGADQYTVVEADEYDRTFLRLFPSSAVVTNIEAEHLDIYKDYEDVKQTFIEFLKKIPFYGFIVACADDKGVREILPSLNSKVITYGLGQGRDFAASDIINEGFGCSYSLKIRGENVGLVKLLVPGEHNIQNSLAAIATACELGIPVSDAVNSISDFTSAGRRLEIKYSGNISVIDDYAHHPTEVKASLNALRGVINGRLILVFQPHLYSRTAQFYREFSEALQSADLVFLLGVYPAREEPIPGINSELIADSMKKSGYKQVVVVEDKDMLPFELQRIAHDGDTFVTMGAGDIYKIGEKLIELIRDNG